MSVTDKARAVLQGDRGASAILVALTLVFLMGMSAIAVDAGIAFEDRRQQQSGADVGALAAIQFADTTTATIECGSLSGTARAACRGAEEAINVVNGTLPGRYSAADWLACSDANKPAEFSVTSSLSPCISFTSNFQKSRVVMPGTEVPTAFARVMGFDSVFVSATAEAALDIDQSADVLPFAVGPSGAGSNLACLFANSSNNLNAYPCDGPTQGNFGKLDLALYGNSTLGTPEICGNSNPSLKMATNIIMGADHFIEEASASPGTVSDFGNCPILSNPVDNLRTQTGNSANGIEDGIWNGISTPTREGKLTCKDGDPNEGPKVSPTGTWPCQTINNNIPESVDNTPLWYYLNTPVTEVANASDCLNVTNRDEMEVCLASWRAYGAHPSTSSLFTIELETAPRFGAVPILATDPSNGSGDYDVIDFRAVYLETVFLKCNANTCDIVFSPGEASSGNCPNPLTSAASSCGWPDNGNKGLVAMTSFMIQDDMLHPTTRETFPNVSGTAVYNLSK